MSDDDPSFPIPPEPQVPDATLRVTGPAGAGPSSPAMLVVIAGPDLGRGHALDTGRVVLGRSSASSIQVEHESVSRTHAEFQSGGDGWVVRDLGSTNGTFVNDARLAAAKMLADGDRIRVGATTFKFLAPGSAEAAYHDELYRRTTRDALTGAFNRAYFQRRLEREWALAGRGGALAVALLDVDHFKAINDAHGHAAGDAVLRGLVARIHPLVGAGPLARYGGEEFALLLAGADASNAAGLAERLRAAIAAAPFPAGARRLAVTVSIGVAGAAPAMAGPEQLLGLADRRLYAAKHAGRNRVVAG
ncbi:MAG TPA: GGDEF domain-containing protein [Opitutaceae bacterium]|nr:GGDEF domain-containing protein [Opitutaceae bacterium]